MSEAPMPTVAASLREFSYASTGPGRTADGRSIDLAEEFHEASKIRGAFPSQALGPGGRYLTTVPDAAFTLGRKSLAHTGPGVALPPVADLPVDLTEVIARRRSELPPQCAEIRLSDLAAMLALSAGASPNQPGLRVAPSGGAMYPIDVVAIAHTVDGLAPGAYVYDALTHTLLPRGTVSPPAFHAEAGGVLAPPQPSLTMVLVATFARARVKYGLRGYRFALMEAGHIAQALITVATALGLQSLPWGGYVDAAVDAALELDGVERSCVYLVAVSAAADHHACA